MELRKRLEGDKVIVEAARMRDGDMTENLFGHMEDLREVMDGIPPLYRGSAKIGIWSETDLVVTYERPATVEEMEEERKALREGFLGNGHWLRTVVENTLRDAARIGVDPSEIGVSVTDGSYVITKQVP